MDEVQHAQLSAKAYNIRAIEKNKVALENMVGAIEREGVPPEVLATEIEGVTVHPLAFAKQLKKARDSLLREARKTAKGSPEYDHVENTKGIGPKCYYLLGLIPRLEEMHGPSAVWKYTGLHVNGGMSVTRSRGEYLGFNVYLRSVAIAHIGDPIIRSDGPYRSAYDDRKAYTRETHPSMYVLKDGKRTSKLAHPDCEHCVQADDDDRGLDCSNVGGVHWTPGHRHADARRVMVKAVLRDLWRVANGHEARF